MELFDCQEYAAALQRDAMRAFRQAERRGLTRELPARPRVRWFAIFSDGRRETERATAARAELRSEN